jgi:molybdopterin/thiamine biosynthesis adenylyltransferase
VRYSLTFIDELFDHLVSHLLDGSDNEKAAYLLCGLSKASHETRLLARDFLPVATTDVLESSRVHMKIASRSFLRAMKAADNSRSCFVFAHSHPPEICEHSSQDDREEAALFSTAYNRIHHSGPHASLVFSERIKPTGRVWLEEGSFCPIDVVRVVGKRVRLFFDVATHGLDFSLFDRQVRAFGKPIQGFLRILKAGIVGAGGTGSSVAEQLIRLGVGKLLIADGGKLEDSNVTRGYGSRLADVGAFKATLLKRLAADVGLGTEVEILDRPVTFQSVLKQFRECDVIFGCTDDEWGRSLLCRLAIYYCIPVFDMGVRIDSDDGAVSSVSGRVTTLYPASACLFCRGRITPERVRAEMLAAVSPGEAEELRKEGYVEGLDEPAPAVISFTTSVAAGAVSELLHRLTGFMGSERTSTEVIFRFDEGRMGGNSTASKPGCFCSNRENWGRGDQSPFLGTTWRDE